MRGLSLLAHALRRLRRRPVRSFLLLQGTVWGVAVAIFPSAVIQGTREAVRRDAAGLGADRVSLATDPTSADATQLTEEHARSARAAVEARGIPVSAAAGVRLAAQWPAEEGRGTGMGLARAYPALLAGPPQAPSLRGLELAQGRWLAREDGPDACVVEAGVAGWLGKGALSPGDRIRLPGQGGDLTVVGVTRPRSTLALSTDDLGFNLEHPLYRNMAQGFLMMMGLPVVKDGWKRSDRCVWVLPGEDRRVDWVFFKVAPDDLTAAASAAREALAREQQTVVTLYPLVLPVLLSGKVERFQAVNAALFLACLAMGAIVMANLGLLSVLTRGREIAIRRVEGASQRDLLWQFLVEGLALAALGSALGVGLGMALAALRASLEPVAGFAWQLPWAHVSIAVGVALTMGLLAALLPALKAARQDPVEGLAGE